MFFRFRKFHFSQPALRDTIFNGSAEFIGQMSMSLSMFAYNWVIMRFIGVTGVAAFTIVGHINSTTRPREEEMSADSLAFLIDEK